MTVTESKVRKGLLTIGTLDHSCQPTSVSIEPTTSQGAAGNELEVLCGDKVSEDAQADELKATLTITTIQDFTDADGFVAQSWKENGKTLDFTWRPTDQAADMWRGKVKVAAVQVGGTVGERLSSDVSWEIVELFLPPRMGGGQVIPSGVAVVPITNVSAGAPGSFSPAQLPADLAALKSNTVVGDAGTSKPSAAWATGQFVTLGDASKAYWDGTAWATGMHP
jgi:hypothetical protein